MMHYSNDFDSTFRLTVKRQNIFYASTAFWWSYLHHPSSADSLDKKNYIRSSIVYLIYLLEIFVIVDDLLTNLHDKPWTWTRKQSISVKDQWHVNVTPDVKNAFIHRRTLSFLSSLHFFEKFILQQPVASQLSIEFEQLLCFTFMEVLSSALSGREIGWSLMQVGEWKKYLVIPWLMKSPRRIGYKTGSIPSISWIKSVLPNRTASSRAVEKFESWKTHT